MDLAPSVAIVTRAAGLLRAAGATVSVMHTKIIDADEHEALSIELSDKTEGRTPDLWIIRGNHEDFGRTILRQEKGVYTVEAAELNLVRGAEIEPR